MLSVSETPVSLLMSVMVAMAMAVVSATKSKYKAALLLLAKVPEEIFAVSALEPAATKSACVTVKST